MSRDQLNVRISELATKLLDNKRIEYSETHGSIPSRSDVVRVAVAAYLGIDVSECEPDGRKTPTE
jgi:hypothetical protein